MKSDLTSRLVEDLRWRLSRLGSKYRPAAREVQSWGTIQIPASVPWLLWALCVMLGGLAADASGVFSPEAGATAALFGAPFLLFWLRGVIINRSALGCYRKLLQRNERFALVEYSKYLKRQIERASSDPSLGGPQEVARLKDLMARLNRLLSQGAGLSGQLVSGELSEEAALAEGIISAYEESNKDPLAELDSRLPPELKQRIEELDRESSRGQKAGTISS